MRAALEAAQRRAAVRAAARDWHEAGWIDEEARRRIEALHPDDRVRQRAALRVLLWIFTVIAASGAFGLAGALGPTDAWGPLCVLGAIGCAALTEVQQGTWRLDQFGTESATAWLALGFALGAVFWLTDRAGLPGETATTTMLAAAAALALLAGWRWGSPLQLGGAAVAGFLLLGRLPHARWSWIAAGAAALPLLDRAAVAPRWAPSHRRGAVIMLLVAAAALGLALHPFTPSRGGGPLGPHDLTPLPAPLAWAGFTAFAGALLAAGARSRRRWLLGAGIAATMALAVTLLAELDVRPAWLVLTLGGAALAGLALLVRRWLDTGAGGERRGFTAAAVLGRDEGSRTLEAMAAVAAASPRPAEPPDDGFRGAGGGFGGGGASSADRTSWLLLAALVSTAFLPIHACAREAAPADSKGLETVEVAPPPDAGASMAEDPQPQVRAPEFSGVLPEDFPRTFPVEPTWSLLDFGAARAGRRYVTLRIPGDLAAARAHLAARLPAAGWKAVGGDGARWSAAGREIRLAYTSAPGATRLRVEY